MIRTPAGDDAGLALAELLVGSAVALVALLLGSLLMTQAHASWRADGARADLQQRTRVAVDLLSRALREAGRGPDGAFGSLRQAFAPIAPRRAGLRDAHPPDAFRHDAFTVLRAAAEAESAVLFAGAPAGASSLVIQPSDGCSALPCGATEGAHVLLLEEGGSYDVFTVTGVLANVLFVRHHGAGSAASYPAGSPVIPVEASSYYLDARYATLRAYDGDGADFPLLDGVAEMAVAYYGDPDPPARPRPPPGGSNCLYAADGSYHSALMPRLDAPGGLVPLPPGVLTDGPWCGSGGNQYDADLLRVRRVRIRLRLPALSVEVRGTDRVLFAQPGTAAQAAGTVADAWTTIEVAPPNLLEIR